MSIDKLAGIYVYAMDYHGGQGTRLYRLLSRIGKQLTLRDTHANAIRGAGAQRTLDEWEDARAVYQHLEARGAE